jgi:hypothetical protein
LPEKGHILRGRTISHSKAKSFGLPKKSKVAKMPDCDLIANPIADDAVGC